MFTTLQFSELWAIYATGSHMITDKDSSLLCCDALFFGESRRFFLYCLILKIQALQTLATSDTLHPKTQHHNLDTSIFRNTTMNVKSHMII
jgi:hypothetical protein